MYNLAAGLVPTGSSDSLPGRFAAATDGKEDPGHWWIASEEDYPGILTLDLGAPAIITGIELVSGDSGFKVLKTYRSDEGRHWTLVRIEDTPRSCAQNGVTLHGAISEPTRFVRIQMEERCDGLHLGRFSLAEWKVFGWWEVRMALQYTQSWPHCDDLGPCFTFADLAVAKATCLADTSCDGFSFSSGVIGGGRGGGCYKTRCRDGGRGRGLGRRTHGYWVKRRGCHAPSQSTFFDTSSGLEVCDSVVP